MDRQRLRIGEWLYSDVELGMRAEIATSMAQIGSAEEGGVWQRLLIAFQSVAVRRQYGDFSLQILERNPHLHSHQGVQLR